MPIGRKTKLTPALQTAMVQAVSLGLPLSTAAHMAGVHTATVLEWIARGGESPAGSVAVVPNTPEWRGPRMTAPPQATGARAACVLRVGGGR